MATKAGQYHWGRWLHERARLVGFLRQSDLAAAIGCTPDRLSRWYQMPNPPAQMRKGFDAALCAALETDRGTLFSGYAAVAPEHAPRVRSDAAKEDPEIIREIVSGATRLSGERLRIAASVIRTLTEAAPAMVA